MIDLKKHTIYTGENIKEALPKINEIPETLTLFVTDNEGTMVGS